MKLYYAKGACSLGPHIIIKELNIPCEFIAVNFADKKTAKGEDYLKINPKGAVPALQLDNGEILTENIAILQYLAETYKGAQLLPAIGSIKRYHVLEWLSYIASDLHKNFGPFFNRAFPESVRDEIFKPMLFKKLDFMNQHLGQQAYLTGSEFTLPDAYAFVVLRWTRGVNIDLNQWPNLVRYSQDIRKRAAVEKAFAEEGLD